MNQEWNIILKNEGLEYWEIIESSGGGLCQYKQKKIFVLPNDDALFLHEVAHALTYKWNEEFGDQTGHHAIWGDKFTELVRKYMTPQLDKLKELEKLKKDNPEVVNFEQAHNHTSFLEEIFETLEDLECLSEKGKEFRKKFYEIYIKL